MQKKISLLYLGNEAPKISEPLVTAIYNLNIDRMVNSSCDSKRQCDAFLDVISRECEGKETASYRAQILKDFIEFPELLSSLLQIFKGYDNLPEETEEVISEIFRYGMPASSTGMLDCAYEELYVNAHYARNVIAYFSEIYELFEEYEVKSEGLLAMKNFCRSINESRCITELEAAAENFKSEHLESYKFTLDTTLDEAARICACSVSAVTDAAAKEKKNILSVFKKNTPVSVQVGTACVDNAQAALSAAITELSGIFSDIGNAVYSVFKGIGAELNFYFVALCIEKRLRANGMHYTFAEVLDCEQDTLEATEIYDMLLLNEGKDVNSIVTNDVSLQKSILARGDNNCGKTSFLRSLGCAVLFAQNGMFVCAATMKTSIRSAIFTHFSSAEKDFSESDAAGRFEGEVKEIAAIIDAIRPFSLVLLNETFQTTAYKEGAQGMKDILDIFPDINCKYVFVTHMSAIFKIFPEGKATVLTAKGYKLLEE